MSQLNNTMCIFYLVGQKEKSTRHSTKEGHPFRGTNEIGSTCIAKFNEKLYWLWCSTSVLSPSSVSYWPSREHFKLIF